MYDTKSRYDDIKSSPVTHRLFLSAKGNLERTCEFILIINLSLLMAWWPNANQMGDERGSLGESRD